MCCPTIQSDGCKRRPEKAGRQGVKSTTERIIDVNKRFHGQRESDNGQNEVCNGDWKGASGNSRCVNGNVHDSLQELRIIIIQS